MTGFVLLDLWKLVADRIALQRSLAKGSLFMANQTRAALQSVAMSVILIALTKDDLGNPFCHGHCRVTELGVEEWFGRIRAQSQSAQHTARSFWKAAAKEMLVRGAKEITDTPPCDTLKPLTPGEFEAASSRAYRSALRLVAMCSNFTEDSLQGAYENLCQGGQLHPDDDSSGLHPFEDDDQGEANLGGSNADEQETKEVVNMIHSEAAMDEADHPDIEQLSQQARKSDLDAVPDADDLLKLTEQCEAPEETPLGEAQEEDPETLMEAVRGFPLKPCMVGLFDELWRLTMYLRHWTLDGLRLDQSCSYLMLIQTVYKIGSFFLGVPQVPYRLSNWEAF